MRAAMLASRVVGDDGAKGGLWCSPVAKKSRPACSARTAISTVFLMRWCSLGALPVAGSVVISPTVKIPNCIRLLFSTLDLLHFLCADGTEDIDSLFLNFVSVARFPRGSVARPPHRDSEADADRGALGLEDARDQEGG